MLVIAMLKNIEQAMMNYRSRKQLKRLTTSRLDDIAISHSEALVEARKANVFVFLREAFISRPNQTKKGDK